jgi:argininosuccinate lyase
LQDDKALVFDGYDTLRDSLTMSFELIDNLKVSKERMYKMANQGFTTATDFADYLVREKKLSFRESYGISSSLVNFAEKNNKTLDQVSLKDLKKFYKNLDKNVLKIFDVRNSMNSKKSYGGTSSSNIKKMIKKYKKEIK